MALVLLAVVIIGNLNWIASYSHKHVQEAARSRNRALAVNRFVQLQTRIHPHENESKSSASGISINSAGSASSPAHSSPTGQSVLLPRIGESVNDEPMKQPAKSMLSHRLLEEGARLVSTHNYDDAIKTYQVGLASDPSNPELLDAIGRANKAKTLASNTPNGPDSSITILRGDNQLSNPREKRESEVNAQSISHLSDPVEKALQAGRRFLALGHYDEAMMVLQNGLRTDPQNQSLRAEIARARSAKSAEEQVLGSP
jgi:tetratricopeptide (TPR) repeat protein